MSSLKFFPGDRVKIPSDVDREGTVIEDLDDRYLGRDIAFVQGDGQARPIHWFYSDLVLVERRLEAQQDWTGYRELA